MATSHNVATLTYEIKSIDPVTPAPIQYLKIQSATINGKGITAAGIPLYFDIPTTPPMNFSGLTPQHTYNN
jgi:hypothetical protein